MKYRHKPTVVEAVTFEEFIELGRKQGALCYGDLALPWSFTYAGYPVTHENDNCYLINVPEVTIRFNRGSVLITGEIGEIWCCGAATFASLYVPVEDQLVGAADHADLSKGGGSLSTQGCAPDPSGQGGNQKAGG